MSVHRKSNRNKNGHRNSRISLRGILANAIKFNKNKINVIDRFKLSYYKKDDCWIWLSCGKKGKKSSGMNGFYINPIIQSVRPNRFSYEYYRTKIKPGHKIVSACGNDICVNPDHLKEVTTSYLRKIDSSNGKKTHCHKCSGPLTIIKSFGNKRGCYPCYLEIKRIHAKKNPDKVKFHMHNWIEKNKEYVKEYRKDYCDKNKDKINCRNKEYYYKNLEESRKKRREYHEKNKDILNEKRRQKYKINKETEICP